MELLESRQYDQLLLGFSAPKPVPDTQQNPIVNISKTKKIGI